MTAAAALAFDLGGTDLRAAIVTRTGEVRQALTVPTRARAGVDAVLDQMASLAKTLMAETDGTIAGVGLGAPGPLDPSAGIMIAPPTLAGWHDVAVVERLSARLGLPVFLDNDANMAALGEWRHGAARGFETVLFVTVSTGIGGGVVSGGRIFHGRRGLAVEIGHMTLSGSGPRCLCGNVGCFEALASGTALGHRGADAALRPGGEKIAAAQSAIGRPGARSVVEAARVDDPVALALIAEEAEWLGIGLTNLLHIFSPDIVVIGGGLSNAFDLLIGGIRSVVATRAMSAYRDVVIVRAGLGTNAGLVGAAGLVFAQPGFTIRADRDQT
ncbi:glucokinase [Rhizobium sp. PP-F2F-G48]|uniref:ROK family protein n=1 Tax=Rhizobium sp. PP-F2F-G48 TaxID=2135651 RepID=UPI001042F684|nr:ROK family protein [Rhizobium sp. PP-F2F-G48]TCM52642.1 glucokinase [Rhizobium sp. PP-F2F-G48]